MVGIVQSEFLGDATTPGWSQTVPFLIVVALLIVRAGKQQSRSASAERAVRLGTGVIRPWLVAALVVIAVVVVQFALSASWVAAVTTSTVGAIIVLSFVPLTGYSGQLSLAQFAFAGWGAWGTGLASWPRPACPSWPPWLWPSWPPCRSGSSSGCSASGRGT